MRNPMLFRLAALVAAGFLLAPAPAGATPAPETTAATALTDLVGQAAHSRASHEPGASSTSWVDTRVSVLRERATQWAFGTVVLVAPQTSGAAPRDWLFIAERTGSGWRLGLDGEPAFAELSARSPVVTAGEKKIFASHGGGTVGTMA